MEVTPFDGEYDDVAHFLGQSAEGLRERDDRQVRRVLRWVARESGRVVGAAHLVARPDERNFLAFGESGTSSMGAIVAAAAADVPDWALFVRLDQNDVARTAALIEAGFSIDLVFEDFKVDFA